MTVNCILNTESVQPGTYFTYNRLIWILPTYVLMEHFFENFNLKIKILFYTVEQISLEYLHKYPI